MRLKKLLAVLLTLALTGAALTGCGDSPESSGSDSQVQAESTGEETSEATENEAGAAQTEKEEVDLTMIYLVSGTLAGQDAVNQALADKAKEDLNINLTVVPMTISEAMSQIELMIAGGEDVDVFPAWAKNMASFVASGYVLDLKDYIDNMPNVLQWVGKDDVLCSNVGGYIWGVTTMRERSNPRGITMRKDILDELGYNIDDIKSLDDLTEVFAAVKEAHPDMVVLGGTYKEGLGNAGDLALVCDPLNDELGVLDNYGTELKVVNEFETEGWINVVKQTRAWYEAGYVSKDMATSNDAGQTLMAAGNLFAFADNYKPDTAAERKAATGYDTVTYHVTEPFTHTTSTAGLGYCISGITEHPDRAVELLDWMFGSAEANDLMNFGIEGTDWVENAEGMADYPEGKGADSVSYHVGMGFAMPNQFAGHLWNGNDADLYQQYQEFRDNAYRSKAYGFSFDSSAVTDEVIACKAVLEEHLYPITVGAVEPDRAISAMNEALYAAGLQKIMDEKQKQLDEWAAENGVK